MTTPIEPTEELLRAWVGNELDSIIFELNMPMNTGLIARTLAVRLRDLVDQWPDVTIHGPVERRKRPA